MFTNSLYGNSYRMDAAMNAEPISLEDIARLPLNKLVRQKEETETEVQTLCNLMYTLNKAKLKYESSVEYVNTLNSTGEGSNVLVPLTNSMYLQADVFKVNNVLVNLDGEYHAEMDKESAINHFFRKIQKVKAKICVAQKILATKIQEMERLRKAVAEKYFEEKKRKEEQMPVSTEPLDPLSMG